MDYHYTIPGPDGPGSMGEGGHSPSVDPPITTALILDPTGPGYRLDSKLVAELSAPLPKKCSSFLRLLPFLSLTFILLSILVLYSEVATHMSISTPGGPEDITSTQTATISTTTRAPRGVTVKVDKFVEMVKFYKSVKFEKFDKRLRYDAMCQV